MLNKKVMAVLLVSTLLTAPVFAGVYMRTTFGNVGDTIVLEKVDSESEQVLDTLTFRLAYDADGFLVPVDVVSVNNEEQTLLIPSDALPGVDGSTIAGASVVAAVAASEASDTIDGADLPTPQEKGILKNGWNSIQKGLSTTANKLEVLYESLKARVSEGTMREVSAPADGASGAAADEAEEQMAELPQIEAEEYSKAEEPNQVK